MQESAHPWKNQVEIGSIEIKVVSPPKVRLETLEGILKSKKSSTELVRELRKEDHAREENVNRLVDQRHSPDVICYCYWRHRYISEYLS